MQHASQMLWATGLFFQATFKILSLSQVLRLLPLCYHCISFLLGACVFAEAAITNYYKLNGLSPKGYCYNSESWTSEIKVLADSVSSEGCKVESVPCFPPGFVCRLVAIFSILTFVEPMP